MADSHLFDPDTTRSLFYDLDSLPTTPVSQLSLPRELAPGVIAYPDCLRTPQCTPGEEEDLCGVCAARSRRPDAVTGAGPYENLPDAVDPAAELRAHEAQVIARDFPDDSAEARRAMFKGFGWDVTE